MANYSQSDPFDADDAVSLYKESIKRFSHLSDELEKKGGKAIANILKIMDDFVKNELVPALKKNIYSENNEMNSSKNPVPKISDEYVNLSGTDTYSQLIKRAENNSLIGAVVGLIDNLPQYIRSKMESNLVPYSKGSSFLNKAQDLNSIKRFLVNTMPEGVPAKKLTEISTRLMRRQRGKHGSAGQAGDTVSVEEIIAEIVGQEKKQLSMIGESKKTWGHFYDDQQNFAVVSEAIDIMDANLFSGIGRDFAASLAAWLAGPFTYLSAGELGDDAGALTNWFFNIGREFYRFPSKGIKWTLNSLLLSAQTPHVYAVDDFYETSDLASLGSIASFFGLQYEKPYSGRTARLGPSVLSWLPGAKAIVETGFGGHHGLFGKGKIPNIVTPLSAGSFLMWGEGIIPKSLDVGVYTGRFAEQEETIVMSPEDFMFSSNSAEKIAKIENPRHSQGIVLQRIRGDWSEKGTSILLGEPEGPEFLTDTITFKGYSTDGSRKKVLGKSSYSVDESVMIEQEGSVDEHGSVPVEAIKEIERKLALEYVPFSFKDLRTNEIISFHAFLEGLSTAFAPSWNSQRFPGRVESIHVYEGCDQTITFSFVIVSINMATFHIMWKKVNKLVSMVYPQYSELASFNDDSGEATSIPFSAIPVGAPIVRLRIGDFIKTNFNRKKAKYILGKSYADDPDTNKKFFGDLVYEGTGVAGILTALDFDFSNSTYETMPKFKAPQFMRANVSFSVIHDVTPGLAYDGINRGEVFPVGTGNSFDL